jgi:hypothetical protein
VFNFDELWLALLSGHGAALHWKVRNMRLSLDPVKDAELIAQRLDEVVPESVSDAAVLVRNLVSQFDGQGVNRADVEAALRQVADELRGQVATAFANAVFAAPAPPAPPAPAAPAEPAPAPADPNPAYVVDPPEGAPEYVVDPQPED